MIQLGTIVKVTDKTSVVLGQCIKVLGQKKKRIALIGDVILVSVQWINAKRFVFLKARLQKIFYKGAVHRALIVRSKVNFCRIRGVHIKFNENAVILVTKNVAPIANRVYGPILLELCLR